MYLKYLASCGSWQSRGLLNCSLVCTLFAWFAFNSFVFLFSESPVVPVKRRVPPSVFPLPRFLPPPLSNAQDCTFVPHNLAQACGTKVVILDCSGAVPVFHGNIVDVFVSPLFRESMRPLLQVPPSIAKILNVQSNQVLNFEANILLLMKYFLQLGKQEKCVAYFLQDFSNLWWI